MAVENVSQDLIWEVVNGQNSYLCKRRSTGIIQLSRDPLNLTNKHSRKYEGFASDQAIGIQARPITSDTKNTNTGIHLTTKRPSKLSQPKASTEVTSFGPNTSQRKTYRSVVSKTAGKGYRPDLRKDAVARASAVKRSQKSERKMVERKPRGPKARKAAAVEE